MLILVKKCQAGSRKKQVQNKVDPKANETRPSLPQPTASAHLLPQPHMCLLDNCSAQDEAQTFLFWKGKILADLKTYKYMFFLGF